MEYFLKRYRQIDPSVEFVDPESLRKAIRVINDSTIDALEKQGAILEKIPWLKNGYWVDSEFTLGSTKEHLLGWYYIQGPLSQLAVEVLNPEGDCLDLAAAPGGKATHMAELCGGVVIALDSDAVRLNSVRNNAERLNLTNIACVKKDARYADLKKKFKNILLDAPCSGNFCSEINWGEKRTIEQIHKNARLQKELLRVAYKNLEVGGKLLYSTCSLEPEEDEEVIKWALEKLELKVIPIDTIGDSSEFGTRFWPHKTGCEGFFICLLEREDVQ